MEVDMEIDDLRSENGDEFEEFLVYIDIDPTSIAVNQITESSLKIFGMETIKPLLQINNQFFEGEFDLSMGTHLFFEKDLEAEVDELYCKSENYYKFSAKTNKILKMSRVLVQDKSADSRLMQENYSGQLEIQKTYEEALNLFLAPGKKAPRTIPAELNCEHLLKDKTAGTSSATIKAEQTERPSIIKTEQQQ